jgi:hypothetical protein
MAMRTSQRTVFGLFDAYCFHVFKLAERGALAF